MYLILEIKKLGRATENALYTYEDIKSQSYYTNNIIQFIGLQLTTQEFTLQLKLSSITLCQNIISFILQS